MTIKKSFITVVTPYSSYCGKVFTVDENNKIKKSGRSLAPAKSFAKSVPCDSLDDLSNIINGLEDGQAIILGWIPEMEEVERFHLVSMKELQRLASSDNMNESDLLCDEANRSELILHHNDEYYLPRKKILFNQAPFFCIDRDVDENAPEAVKEVQALNNDNFLRVLCEDIGTKAGNAFYGASFLPVTSSSGQVFKTDGTPYVTDPSCHIFFQANDADDIERFGTALFAHSIAHGFGYDKQISRSDDVKAFRKQSIFDPSVFTIGRLFFESSPKVGMGLEIRKTPCFVCSWEGKNVDTSLVEDPDLPIQQKLEEQGISWESGKRGSYMTSDSLYPQMVVITQDYGEMSVEQFERSTLDRARCQTPFRDSTSWAAYLNRHTDGEVYLWDEGTRTKHRLIEEESIAIERALNPVDKVEPGGVSEGDDVTDFSDDVTTQVHEEYDWDAHDQRMLEWNDEDSYPEDDNSQPFEHFNLNTIAKPEPMEKNFYSMSLSTLVSMDLRHKDDMCVWGDGILVKGGLSVLGGAPKVGKSSFVLKLLMSAACGIPFLGYTFPRPMRVQWIQAELMLEFLRDRVTSMLHTFTLDQQALILENFDVTNKNKSTRHINGKDRSGYIEMVREFNPDIVVIDPFRNLVAITNESDSVEMGKALDDVKQATLSVNPDISVLIVHHLRKYSSTTGGEPFDLFSGSGALRGYYDTGMVLLKDDQNPKSMRQLHFEVRNGEPVETVDLEITKAGDWVRDSALIDDAIKKTEAKSGVEYFTIKFLIDVLRNMKAISYETKVPWSQALTVLKMELDKHQVERVQDDTIVRYVKKHNDKLVFLSRGRGRGDGENQIHLA